MKTIVLFGASGLIGSYTHSLLENSGYTVLPVSRHSSQGVLPLDFKSPELLRALSDAYGVINLSGAPIIGKRLTTSYKQVVRDSRIGITSSIVEVFSSLKQRPDVFINGSAIGFYGSHDLTDVEFNETTPVTDRDYWSELTAAWETAALPAQKLGIRTVLLRTGLVLSPENGGTLWKLVLPFRLGLGGPVGVRDSWRSWIHIDDEVGLILHALEKPISGPVNATSPTPLRNFELSQSIGKAVHRPSWLPVPELPVRLAFGEASEVITRGKQIIPQVAQASGYTFLYGDIKEALKDLLP